MSDLQAGQRNKLGADQPRSFARASVMAPTADYQTDANTDYSHALRIVFSHKRTYKGGSKHVNSCNRSWRLP
jgi:hypothetical protein